MPVGHLETFGDIETAWHMAEREADKRAVWRALMRGGWLHACRDAVRRAERLTLERWLDTYDPVKQNIVQFHSVEATHVVHLHLLCGLAACWAQEGVSPNLKNKAPRDTELNVALRLLEIVWEIVAPQQDTSCDLDAVAQHILQETLTPPRSAAAVHLAERAFCLLAPYTPAPSLAQFPLGFFRDLTRELLGEPLRLAERALSLTVLLVDTVRNEGVVATLTLELMPDGNSGLYPGPELAFIRDPDFRRAEENVRRWAREKGVWQTEQDIRWRLQRRDGQPIVNLAGPSIGAASALGLAKLLTTS